MKKTLLIAGLALIGTWLAASPNFSNQSSFTPPAVQYAGWNYTLPIQIHENSGSLVVNYQARLTVNTQALIAAGQMDASGNDIRFGKDCAASTLYNYWIESGINTSSTVIWVKIDTLFANSTRTFYMFYGNSSATAVSAVSGTFFGPMSSTDSVASGGAGGVGNSQRGFRFAPTEDLLVTAFGKREPTGTTRYVTLFNFTTQAIVTQTQVAGPAAQYSYSNIPNPIWLTQGTQYLLELYQGASDGYYFGTSSQIGQHMQYFDMRYCNSCTQNTFPTNTLTNYHYGYPDLWYFTKNNVSPAPSITYIGTPTASLGADVAICPGDSVLLSATINGGSGNFVYSWSPVSGISSPLAATTWAHPSATASYVFAVIDNSACATFSTDTIQVTVHPAAYIAATTLNDSLCPGDSTDLIVTGALSYVWQPGGNMSSVYSVSPSVSTTYTVVGTDVNGCRDTAWVDIIANPQPVVTVSGSASTICSNASTAVTMTASGALNYAWTPINATTATVSDTPVSSTTYTVIGTDANGCSDTANYSVTVNPSPTVQITGVDSVCSGSCVTMIANATGGTPAYTYTWSTLSTTAAFTDCPTSSTCYYIDVMDMNGCAAADTFCVYVFPAPMIAATGNSAICAGDTAVLNATGSNIVSIDWSPSSGLNTTTGYTVYASPSSTTTYTVVGTSPDGCTDSTTLSLTVNPLPNVTFTSSVNTVCSTDPTFALTGGSPAGGSYSGPGVSGSNFSPATAGTGTHTITYSYTDPNGCSSFATHTITVSPCTGIAEQSASGTISVYPNPFTEKIRVVREDGASAVANLYDNQGRLVLSQQIIGTNAEIGTEGIASGIYTLQIVGANGIESFRVVRN